MDPISFTRPIDEHYVSTGLQTALAKAFKQVFAQNFEQSIQDLLDYGCPHIGSKTVVERFSKQNGLVVLRRNRASQIERIQALHKSGAIDNDMLNVFMKGLSRNAK